MKSVLISIQPKWCELIASGKKTIEVRKTAPKGNRPFKVYVYQTKRKWIYRLLEKLGLYRGKVIGEFVCDWIDEFVYKNGGFLICGSISTTNASLKQTCLTDKEFREYAKEKSCYGWHISNLKVYDVPKELGDFWKGGKCPYNLNDGCTYKNHCYRAGELNRCGEQITSPPQSWCYVED